MISIPKTSKFSYKLQFYLLILFSISLIKCSPSKRIYKDRNIPEIPEHKIIRILLSENLSSDKLSFNYPVTIRTQKTNVLNLSQKEGIEVKKTPSGVELVYGRNKFVSDFFDIYPNSTEKVINYKDNFYRGILRIKSNNSSIVLLNLVDIEDYLKGIVLAEMGVASGKNEFEALKAFTICARNFAYMKIAENRNYIFDVHGDIRDQVYSGFEGERNYISKAVDETRNLILTYKGNLAKTFYFSSCGGSTENCGNVFRERNIPYLMEIRDGNNPFCSISTSFNWEEEYSEKEFISMIKSAAALNEPDYSIDYISVKSRYKSGRVNELGISLKNKKGDKDVVLKGNNIRYVIRSKKGGLLKSTMFDIKYSRNKIKITGKGYGHGVGLCQWGAIGQSRQGYNYKDILKFYFPGTSLEKI